LLYANQLLVLIYELFSTKRFPPLDFLVVCFVLVIERNEVKKAGKFFQKQTIMVGFCNLNKPNESCQIIPMIIEINLIVLVFKKRE
jgi:hypothetical protein